MNIQNTNTEVELNQFFYVNGTGTSGWSHYFYLKPFMYRIDSFYFHNYKGIQDYKLKIDNHFSFYEIEAKGLSHNSPYPQLDNGNIYDKLFHYSYHELKKDYLQNQFYNTILNNKYFDFWGAEIDYQPSETIFGGENWELIIDVTINGKRKHKEITGDSNYPEGFSLFEKFLAEYNSKATFHPVKQNIKNPNSGDIEPINKESILSKLFKLIFKNDNV